MPLPSRPPTCFEPAGYPVKCGFKSRETRLGRSAISTSAVIYAAKSTSDPHGSIGRQLDDCRELAEREGWEVVGEHQDEGFSAFSGNRGPGLEAARRQAEATAAERGSCVFVAQHSDRVSRGAGDRPDAPRHLVEVVASMRRVGVTLRTVQDDFFGDSRMGLVMAAMMGQRNTEDSARKSEATSSGKDGQMERGQRLGGPVPDGLKLAVDTDSAGRVLARTYERDPERAPVVERAFELSEQGHGDAAVARTLNAEGFRTKAGKPWARRRVQDMLLNQTYAARVVRRGRGSGPTYVKSEEPEVVQATNVEPLVEPDRYDRITALRAERDRVAPKDATGRKRSGRRTRRFALARLAKCDRCGEPMYATTSPYERKDGTHNRQYVCGNVRGSVKVGDEPACDQPKLDAERVDTAVVAYLEHLFVDFDEWTEQLARGAERERHSVRARLDEARAEVDRLRGLEEKLKADYMRNVEAGKEDASDLATEMLGRNRAHLEVAEADVKAEEEALEAAGPPPSDALLDAYNDLAAAVRGDADASDNLGALNDRLRAAFDEFRLGAVPGEDVVAVLPVLRPQAVEAVDIAAAYEAWVEAGEPAATEEEVAEYERLSRLPVIVSADGAQEVDLPPDHPAIIWATSRDAIRPPARRLEVSLTDKRSNTHE